jgi:hypothetical protein
VAIIYMPLITIFTRANTLKVRLALHKIWLFLPVSQNEAYCFLGGSLGSLSLTIWFLPVLYEQFSLRLQDIA